MVKNERVGEHEVDQLFLNRWSSRALTGEDISEEKLLSLFEAARWAPSSFNEQPWRFVYAKRGTKEWEKMFFLLDEWNKSWCKNASYLICLLSKKTFTKNGKPNRNYLSDAGAAWENLALQATMNGMIAHGMAGYSLEGMRKALKVPQDYEVVHMIAVGIRSDDVVLPENVAKEEFPKLVRRSVKDFAFKGEFNG